MKKAFALFALSLLFPLLSFHTSGEVKVGINVTQASTTLESFQKQLADVENDIRKKQKTKATKEQNYAGKSSAIRQRRQNIVNYESQITDLEVITNNASGNFNENDIQKAQKDIAGLKKLIAKEQSEIDEDYADSTKLSDEIATLTTELSQLEADKAAILEKIRTLDENFASSTSDCAGYQTAYEQCVKDNNRDCAPEYATLSGNNCPNAEFIRDNAVQNQAYIDLVDSDGTLPNGETVDCSTESFATFGEAAFCSTHCDPEKHGGSCATKERKAAEGAEAAAAAEKEEKAAKFEYDGPTLNGPGLTGGATIVEGRIDGNVSRERNLKELIIGWTNFLLSVAAIMAVVALVWAGFLYITAFGDDSRMETAKKIVIWVVAGILLILGAYAIVNTVMSAVF